MRASEAVALAYMTAKEAVIKAGFASEIDWQDEISFDRVTEPDFLKECAWVILSCGMAEAVIRRKFRDISGAFDNWQSASDIWRRRHRCIKRAKPLFGHLGKLNAITTVAERVMSDGFSEVKAKIAAAGVQYIRTLPFMGPATSYHLAKNIGLDVVKPDRHLIRAAKAAGFESPARLCEEISQVVGDKISTIDLVIWRFATLNRSYQCHFASR